MKSELKETVTALKAKVEALEMQNSGLKSRLFEQNQNHDLATEEQRARESIDLRGQLDIIEDNYKQLLSKSKNNLLLHKSTPAATACGAAGGAKAGAAAAAGAAEVGGGDDGAPAGGEIRVNRADYERVLKDHAELEVLVEGFQRENERLSKQLKELQTEHQVRSALYFDERSQMNKELNRLRNMLRSGTGTSVHLDGINPIFPGQGQLGEQGRQLPYDEVPVSGGLLPQKTAEVLRAELQHDATVRQLKERLAEAEAGSGQRERAMQATIEKLRKENRELAALAAASAAGAHNGNKGNTGGRGDSDFLHMQSDNSTLQAEVSQLKSKLSWYIQNQKLIDTAEEERQQWQAVAAALQKELLGKKGVDRRDVDRIVQMAMQQPHSPQQQQQRRRGGATQHTSDTSYLMDRSVETSSRTGIRQPRSFADIKRIKCVASQDRLLNHLQPCPSILQSEMLIMSTDTPRILLLLLQ